MSTYQFPFCTLEETWTGEFPYFSVCYTTIKTVDGKTFKFSYETEINPKGETSGDYYRRFAKNYIPEWHTLDDLFETLQGLGKTKERCDVLFEKAKEKMQYFIKKRGPSKESLCDFSDPYMLEPAKQKKARRREWRIVYNNRKWAKMMTRNPAHLMQWYLQGIDYTPSRLRLI